MQYDAPEDADSKRTFKFPFIACEIFTCEIDVILETLVEDEELMNMLFSFLEPNHTHCSILPGYFSKAHDTIFRRLVDVIGTTSSMEILIQLVGADDHMYPNYMDIMQRLANTNLLGMIVDKLSPYGCDHLFVDMQWDDLDIAEAELEWLSNFFDDNNSFTADFPKCGTTTIAANDSNDNSGKSEEDSLFRTSSPVSVLEPNSLSIGGSGGGASTSSSSSSSSCSGTDGGSSGARTQKAPPISHPEPILVVPARARSKRPRPATFSSRPHVTIPFLSTSSAPTPVASSSSSQSESFGESDPGPATMTQKKKKRKSSTAAAAGGDEAPPVRKCMHCEIQKTPQWRAGPMGPKTLCNACGVRYKSGRLFPEYRPAASPTFVPALHSNSHKKVVEIRIKASQRAAAAGLPSLESVSKDSCDLLAYIRGRE
ncbi:putative GATA transcription factor 11 [Cocos nucifera]|uniref:Putative GATA transcription factor 11 n=1 Tax=Cocos nucifera TaxID=13894 RepID=A0A8K0IJC7_COCNU|nr:putative GATA transcription factor 11 [Cocos nucifera]